LVPCRFAVPFVSDKIRSYKVSLLCSSVSTRSRSTQAVAVDERREHVREVALNAVIVFDELQPFLASNEGERDDALERERPRWIHTSERERGCTIFIKRGREREAVVGVRLRIEITHEAKSFFK
jgi:hypothetical protein